MKYLTLLSYCVYVLDAYLNLISMGETEQETIGYYVYLEIIILTFSHIRYIIPGFKVGPSLYASAGRTVVGAFRLIRPPTHTEVLFFH